MSYMKLMLLDKEKITKMTLPEEVDGVFIMKYRPVASKVIKELSVEAHDGNWCVKSNEIFNIVVDNQIVLNTALHEYMHINVFLIGLDTMLDLYCLPTIDSNYSLMTICTTQLLIGSTNQCAIVFNNDNTNAVYAGIVNNNSSWYIAKPDEGNNIPIYLNDKIVTQSTYIKSGDIIFINGVKIIWMNSFIHVCGLPNTITFNSLYLTNYDLATDYDNQQYTPINEEESNIELYQAEDYFFHTPNLKQHVSEKNVVIDPPPPSPIPPDNGLITSSASITLLASSFSTGMSLMTSISSGAPLSRILPMGVTFGAMLIGSVFMPKYAKWYNARVLEKKEKFRLKKYAEYLESKAKEISTEMNKQKQILCDNYPSISNLLKTFNANNSFVWSREIKDEDFLQVRLGVGSHPAEITVQAPEEHFVLEEDQVYESIYDIVNASRILEDVPITFSLLNYRISAIICNNEIGQSFIDSIITQIALFHSAADLKIVFLNNEESSNYSLSYAKFLPHCFDKSKTLRFYSENSDEMKILSAYLMNIYKERVDEKEQNSEEVLEEKNEQRSYRKYETYYLVVTNDYMSAKSLPITDALLNADDNYGFSYLILDNSMKKLPNQCKAFVNVISNEGCIMERDLNNQTQFVPEYCDVNARTIGTQLMNIPIMEVDEQSQLPTSLSFLEMFGVSKIEQLNITNRWKNNDPTVSLATPIGVHTSGEVFTLDLHEKSQGPHGLIAGSTGSGKSEFIITFILSLCVNYHPDEVQFVLIDYKGGGLTGAFEKKDLGKIEPHIAGTITNLDAGQINRSLVSINSELKRRQRVFNESKSVTGESTIDIYKYQKYYREGIVKEPISHLFIISDEFAELKAQQPDFMNELVSTARIGRSLGVHLILATQKPSGVVNEQIWSNTRFRVCLKVASKSDSMEMLKRPEAASIKETGRYYLEVGYDEYFDIGQSGWAGAKYVPTDRIIKKVDNSIVFVNNTGGVIKTANNIVKKEAAVEMGDQLTNITKYLMEIAEKNDYHARKLWLDSIPEYVYIGNLAQKYNYVTSPYVLNPIIGEYDNPEGQAQHLLTLDLTNKGNTIIYGASGSGQDNLLSTIIYSSAIYHSPEEINFYVIDLGAETLKVFNKVPHVGDICTIDDTERITNLLVMLDTELDRRKQLFSDYNGEYNYYIKKSNEKLPYICCIINNYDVFLENFRKMGELLEPFYRDCSKYGIAFIITCSTGTVIRSKVSEYFQNKMCLRMGKDEDYRNILNAAKGLIPDNYKGRGIVKLDKKCYEFQTAYIYTPDLITDTIKSTGEKLSLKYNYKIKRVPVLPDTVTLDYVEGELTGLNNVPVGYDISSKTSYSYDFSKEIINIISANSLDGTIHFVYALSTLLSSIKNLKVKVIDFTKTIDSLQVGGEIVSTDFNNVISTISQEMANDAQSTVKHLYLFIGLSGLKNIVSEESFNLYKTFMSKAKTYKNTTMIILEEYDNLKKLQLETWYISNINKNAGIWIGEGVGTQNAITFKNLPMEVRKLEYKDMAFVGDKNGVTPIRLVVSGMEEDNEG